MSCSQNAEKPAYKITAEKGNPLNVCIFGIHPYKNPKAMLEAYYPIVQYLNEQLGDIEIQLEMSKDYSDFEKKLYNRQFHFALPNPYQAINAIKVGYDVIAKMSPDDDFRGIIVARKDRHIRSVKDLKGKKISYPSATALAAAMMPKMMLYEMGINPEKETISVYVGSQESSILNAYYGDTFAAATWPVPWRLFKKKHPSMAQEMEVVWKTKPLPNNAIVVRTDVDKDVVRRFLEALEKMNNDKKAVIYFENLEIERFERADNKTYDPVERFVKRYNLTLGKVK
ncbi:MAG: phosphate/phosphite/phosphonate ABC transporter substrate-binding protein [Thermodesulfovibrionales bacterium]|nr:phosphate/phosphite/phosphonate ABC transporter substrate-binding protein [Thermodesulfovibrionales bacterium]